MKSNVIIIVLFLQTLLGFAQIKGMVVDENDKPIPYVNIWLENKNLGATSEENGTFIIAELNGSQTLLFTALGFKEKTVSTTAANKVVLQQLTIELKEVQIQNPLASLTNQIDKFDRKIIHLYYGLGPTQWFLAKKFTFNDTIKQTPYLKSIIANTRSYGGSSSVRVRIMAIGSDGNPEEDLITDNLIFKLRNGERNEEWDVSKYKLKIEEEGIFVAVEYLMVEGNQVVVYDKNKKPYFQTRPAIGTIPSEEVTFWIYNKDWRKMSKRNPYNYPEEEHYFNKYIELAMSLKLTN
jgi:hypothetical protein